MRWPFIVWIVVFCCSSVTGGAADDVVEDEMPIRDLRLPLDNYEDGRVKTELTAQQAKAPMGGAFEARGVKVAFFNEAGEVDILMKADTCRYDREKMRAESDSAVTIDHSDMAVTGVGFQWESVAERIKILKDVKVVLSRNIRLRGTLPGGPASSGARQEKTKESGDGE